MNKGFKIVKSNEKFLVEINKIKYGTPTCKGIKEAIEKNFNDITVKVGSIIYDKV